MTANRLDPVLRHVRNLGGQPADDLPDAALLSRFAASGDEASFTVLVRRHGPMVLGLCKRLLTDHHRAEDAFQATFLLLAKKARWLRQPDRLGPWLYGVARRVALKARAVAARRREVAPVDVPAVMPPADDLRAVLDAAIARLPARYRTPVVLCYLQGLTYAEAAERLRCPPGTVATRLSRARDRLRTLLVRQGVAPAAGALTAALTPEATAAFVPDELWRSTARWAAALAAGTADLIPIPILTLSREVATTMILDKLKVLAVLLVIGVTGAGVALSRTGPADGPAKPDAPQAKADVAPKTAMGGERPVSLARLRQKTPDAYRVDAGDVLGIFVEGVLGERGSIPPIINLWSNTGANSPPAIGFPIPVLEDGTITPPLRDPINVAGRSIHEVHETVQKAYLVDKLIPPMARVIVSIAKPRTYRVTVFNHIDVRDSRNPMMSLDLPAYENDVLTALSKSFGLPFSRERAVVVIERGSADGGVKEIRIPLRAKPGEPLPFKPEDVILKNGDVLSIEQEPETAAGLSMAVAAPDGLILVKRPPYGPWEMFDPKRITATETDGKPVDNLGLRLHSLTHVLVSFHGKPPPAEYLQQVKPGTPVLIIRD